jgi:hypothetical protein
MNHLRQQKAAHYHEARQHQAKDNKLSKGGQISEVRCQRRLGGRLKHCYGRRHTHGTVAAHQSIRTNRSAYRFLVAR